KARVGCPSRYFASGPLRAPLPHQFYLQSQQDDDSLRACRPNAAALQVTQTRNVCRNRQPRSLKYGPCMPDKCRSNHPHLSSHHSASIASLGADYPKKSQLSRSEERRVGKESRYRLSQYHLKNKSK